MLIPARVKIIKYTDGKLNGCKRKLPNPNHNIPEMAELSIYMPADLHEAFRKGHIADTEIITISLRGVPIKLPAIYLAVPGRLRNDLFDRVVTRITSEYPHNTDEIILSYNRDPAMFKHICDYLLNPTSWVCPDVKIKAELISLAEYFQLPKMITALNKISHKEASLGRPYFRVEVGRSGVIDVPMAFGEDVHQIAQRHSRDTTITPNAPRVTIGMTNVQDVMDEFVVELIGRGYNLFAVNDLETRSIYHFRN
jgi:hypothetical protein